MPRKTPTRAAFNMLLSNEEKAMLKALATQHGTSEGAEMRAALRARHAHLVLGAPTCASGQVCFMPHMHARPAAPVSQLPNGNPGHAV